MSRQVPYSYMVTNLFLNCKIRKSFYDPPRQYRSPFKVQFDDFFLLKISRTNLRFFFHPQLVGTPGITYFPVIPGILSPRTSTFPAKRASSSALTLRNLGSYPHPPLQLIRNLHFEVFSLHYLTLLTSRIF